MVFPNCVYGLEITLYHMTYYEVKLTVLWGYIKTLMLDQWPSKCMLGDGISSRVNWSSQPSSLFLKHVQEISLSGSCYSYVQVHHNACKYRFMVEMKKSSFIDLLTKYFIEFNLACHFLWFLFFWQWNTQSLNHI